jgi:hypothetical protein
MFAGGLIKPCLRGYKDSETRFTVAKQQLAMLCTLNVVFLAVVASQAPFVDESGHHGFVAADKAEMLALFAQLLNYGVGAVCLHLTQPKEQSTQPLTKAESFAASTLSTVFISIPLIYMYWSVRRRKRHESSQGDEDSANDDEVHFSNPMDESELDSSNSNLCAGDELEQEPES